MTHAGVMVPRGARQRNVRGLAMRVLTCAWIVRNPATPVSGVWPFEATENHFGKGLANGFRV